MADLDVKQGIMTAVAVCAALAESRITLASHPARDWVDLLEFGASQNHEPREIARQIKRKLETIASQGDRGLR